jgi:hypothetical protein
VSPEPTNYAYYQCRDESFHPGIVLFNAQALLAQAAVRGGVFQKILCRLEKPKVNDAGSNY